MSEQPKIGFVGLGQMGRPMAQHLNDWPGGLAVFDPDVERATAFVTQGATMAASVGHVAEMAEVIGVVVRPESEVRRVVGELLEGAAPGSVLMLHSAVHPSTVVELAAVAAEREVHVVDAAMSGGPGGAQAGRLTFLVGGSDEAVEFVRPVLERMGDLVLHMGPAGAGNRARIARNLVLYVGLAAAGEAARLAEAFDLDLIQLGHAVRHSDQVTGGPGALLLRESAGPLGPDDPWAGVLQRLRSLGEKDLEAALALAGEVGVETPLAVVALRELAASLGVPGSEGPQRE